MPFDIDEVTFDELEDENESEDLDQQDQSEEDNVDLDEENAETIDEESLRDSFSSSDNESESTNEEDEQDENVEDQETEDQEDEEAEEEEESVRIVDEIASQFGVDPEEDLDGELDDTFEDVTKVTRKGAEKMAQKEINTFFEQYPDVAQYTRYRVNGGDPDTFREEVLNSPDYEDLELEGNESTQERIVREKLQEVDGFSDDKVDQKVETYKSGGILKSEAEDAKDILSNRQEQKRQELIEQQEQEAKQRREQIKQQQQEYRQTIRESNDLAGMQLPEDQKDTFESYLFDPVDEDGMTQAQKDYQNMSQEEALSLYYLMFNGGPENLDELVDNKASTKRAERLSEKLKKNSGSRDVSDKSERGSGGGRKRNEDADLSGFDLDQAIA